MQIAPTDKNGQHSGKLNQPRTQHSVTSEEPAMPRTTESPQSWNWAIGMLTTTHRTGGMLARTLESYRGSGFAPPVVFTDADRNGGLWNLHRALKTLVEQNPDADAYMIIEDDVLFSKDIREYLESELWPGISEHGCICSIFTPTAYSAEERWHIEDRGSRTWMSQCRIYHPRTAKKLAADLEHDKRLQVNRRQIDATVGGWAKKNNVNIWFHSPSLTQHISPKNTSYEANRLTPYRATLARDFIGENRSIHEYWEEYGMQPRTLRSIPKLEVVARQQCVGDGVKFQFTPEMAKNLAGRLDHYNCDIEELSFVGDDLLSWEYAGRCVYPLRLTGKIMWTRITIPLKENVDLLSYERLFDAIDVEYDGTKPDRIKKYMAKRFYTICTKDNATAKCRNVLRLLGEEVYWDRHHVVACDAKPVLHVPSPCCWTLDEFFQNLDEILARIEQETCEACPKCPSQPCQRKGC